MPFGIDLSKFRLPLTRVARTQEDRDEGKSLQVIGAGASRFALQAV